MVFVGLDVSKGYIDGICLDEQSQPIGSLFQLPDNRENHEWLKAHLKNLLTEFDLIKVAVESTGGYENNWVKALLNCSDHVSVYRLNPVRVKRLMESKLIRSIDDGISAEAIANCIRLQHKELSPLDESSERFAIGRKQLSYCDTLTKHRTALINELNSILYPYFPEVIGLFKNKTPNWLFYLLSKYPNREKILKARKSALLKVPGITEERRKRLKDIVDQKADKIPEPISEQLQEMALYIIDLSEKIKRKKQAITQQCKDEPEVKLLTSIPGVAEDSAAVYFLEIEELKRFSSAAQMASYFGVHPTLKKSGDGTKKIGMSKKGRPRVRATLFMNAFSGMSCNPILRKLYLKYRSKGMNHFQAMGVLMHKLLRIIYGMLKSGKSFDAKLDQKNQERSAKEKQKPQQQALQKELAEEQILAFENAPISSRKRRKLKKASSVPIE